MMTISVYRSSRGNGYNDQARSLSSDHLPAHSSAVREKWKHTHSSPWLVPYSLPIPGVKTRRLRLMLPNISVSPLMRLIKRRARTLLVVALLVVALVSTMLTVVMLSSMRMPDHVQFVPEDRTWTTSDPSTLVYRREDLQRVWEWEVNAGHYPSSQKIPETIGFTRPPFNPGLPPTKMSSIATRFDPPSFTSTVGIGANRTYTDIDKQSNAPILPYPPRPIPGSVADMDVIMNHCDFSQNKYVRDCLEVLRVGAGLDTVGAKLRRGSLGDWKYLYIEDGELHNKTQTAPLITPALTVSSAGTTDSANGIVKKWNVEWEPHVFFPPPPRYIPHRQRPESCEDNPHLFHMFWAGPFTDKPYVALLSFLYTQNLHLHLDPDQVDPTHCRPKYWVWINPGPAASVPNPTAMHDMFESLKVNPWASPFLHPRFKDVIQFKLWNTTEQLDGIPELKNDWRDLGNELFKSGGVVERIPNPAPKDSSSGEGEGSEAETATENDQVNRVGSKSRSSYDKLSVILSDLARFVLCHRFGGIYLDVDNILLRDWEELWGWRGAFAYRWSRLPRYNTAVLKLNKGSALGTFLFRTALKNGLDLHPMTVSQYTEDASLESLLLRLPDAMFDPAWLNVEGFQRERPPQPHFYEFGDLFFTPQDKSAAPSALGFSGFFRGAYSYHFHNFWWQPFDAVRNWPDLGPRFINGELQARAQDTNKAYQPDRAVLPEDMVADDKRDLDWSVVMKRTFEAYIRGDAPNMYGEWLKW